MRYGARLILSKCSLPDLPLWIRAYLILPDHRCFCNSSDISRTILLLYSDQLCPQLSFNNFFFFCCFHGVMAQFEIIKHKFPYQTTLHVHLCGFQITHGGKKRTTCQRTYYHGTTNHSGYLWQLELLQLRDIPAWNKYGLKYCKT